MFITAHLFCSTSTVCHSTKCSALMTSRYTKGRVVVSCCVIAHNIYRFYWYTTNMLFIVHHQERLCKCLYNFLVTHEAISERVRICVTFKSRILVRFIPIVNLQQCLNMLKTYTEKTCIKVTKITATYLC